MADVYEEILQEENEKSYKDTVLFKRLWQYIKNYKLLLSAAFLMLGLSTIVDLSMPSFVKYGIDNFINVEYRFDKAADGSFKENQKGQYRLITESNKSYMIHDKEKIEVSRNDYKKYGESSINKITMFAGGFLILLVFQLFFNYGQVVFSSLLGQKVIYDVRSQLFKHVMNIEYDFFVKNPSGKITTRVVNDTQNISEFFTEVLTSMTKDVLILIGVVILLFINSVQLTMNIMITFPIVLVATYIFKIFDRKAYDRMRTRVSAVNAYLAENISGAPVTKLFNQEERKRNEFDKMNTKLYRAKMGQTYVFAVFRPIINFIYYITLSLVLWFGSGGLRNGAYSFGLVYMFVSYVDMFFNPLFDIAEKYDIMQNAFASASKIFKIFDHKEEEKGSGKYKDFNQAKIEFKDVWFSYSNDENWILKGASFNVKPLERVAVVGETGSGKTTIIKLLNGLYQFQKGQVFIDDKPLYDYDMFNLRKKVAVVPQDVYLFTGSVYDNIRLFNEEISKEDVIKAAKMVHADEIIRRFSDGYDTQILERGATLSSGEKQLIALARAVLFDARIIVLDEATANIDVETEHLIQQALNSISDKVTIVSIAHRLSTVKNSERIIVVHKGRIVEEGTHDALLDKGGVYYDLYKLQFENEEA